jgi:hypothetical protein
MVFKKLIGRFFEKSLFYNGLSTNKSIFRKSTLNFVLKIVVEKKTDIASDILTAKSTGNGKA